MNKQELETIRAKAPLMSEGAISPYQVSNMNKREKQEWNKNKEIRFNAEQEFKKQNRTKEEIKQEKLKNKIDKLETRKIQINSQIRVIKNLPQIKSKRDNSLKRTYNNYIVELEEVNLELKQIEKGGLNGN